jgi:hypothetical protein
MVACAVALAAAAEAQVWPETWQGSKRLKAEALPVEDRGLWFEYGGEASERALYDGPVGKFRAMAWRLKDSTSAFAFYQSIRPEKCVATVPGVAVACQTPSGAYMARQNYVLGFDGWRPLEKEIAALVTELPQMRSGGGLPLLPGYLPEKGRVRNSERYVLGPTSLERFLPQVPAALAGLEDGAEAQVGRFQASPGGEVPYAVFYFHTPQLAAVKLREFEKQAGWSARRSGALVGVIPVVTDEKTAKSLLGGLDWKAEFVWNQAATPPKMPPVGSMLVAIFELTGVLLVTCVGGGIALAGLWFLARQRRIRLHGSDETITLIDLR